MGDVQVKFKVMPEDPEGLSAVKDQVESSVPEGVELVAVDEEPVAFGLKALMVTVVVPDAAGGSDAVEEQLSSIDGVQSVQVEDLTRLM